VQPCARSLLPRLPPCASPAQDAIRSPLQLSSPKTPLRAAHRSRQRYTMDFKGAATKEVAALQALQQYLTILATERCKPAAPQGPRAYAPEER